MDCCIGIANMMSAKARDMKRRKTLNKRVNKLVEKLNDLDKIKKRLAK